MENYTIDQLDSLMMDGNTDAVSELEARAAEGTTIAEQLDDLGFYTDAQNVRATVARCYRIIDKYNQYFANL